MKIELGPLPEPDGVAEADLKPIPGGGYSCIQVAAWSKDLVLSYAEQEVAKERERCARFVEDWPQDPGAWPLDALAAAIRALDKEAKRD